MSSTRSRFSRVSLKPQLGLAAALAVFRDARGLLEENAQLLGLRLDHARDHALLDDGVGARAQARAEEDVRDVAAAHVDVVDVVGRIAVALQHALDRDLRVLRPLPGRFAEAVVENQLDARAIDRLALAGAVEKHVLHRLAAQMLGRSLAEHPAHRVDDVRFAAAVGADDADELAGSGNASGIYERLEAGEVDLGEAHCFAAVRVDERFIIELKNQRVILTDLLLPNPRSKPLMPSKPTKTLETFANPAPGRDYRIHMEIPGVHVPVSEDRAAGFRDARCSITCPTSCASS